MKIAVMGAGAVGCYYGGLLARAGHEVTLIGRAMHVEAIHRHGLRVQTATETWQIPLSASESPDAAMAADLVLCCVKSDDTEAAGEALLPYLKPGAVVMSLQNGVDNAERLEGVLGRPVIATVVYVATHMSGPGQVMHHGGGELVLAAAPAAEEICGVLRAAQIPASVSSEVVGALWAKLVINCAYNGLSAITQLPYGELTHGEGVAVVMRTLVNECLAVARRRNIVVPGNMWESVVTISEAMAGQYSSTAQDLVRGKPSEIDHLNGYIVRCADDLEIPVPVNRTIHTLVKLLESRPVTKRPQP